MTAQSTEPAHQPVQRTRVVLADVARIRDARRTTTELTQQSQVGDALLRGLIRAQLGLALRMAAVLVVGLGSLPLLFAVAPNVAGARPLGIGLPWLLLGLGAYPFLFTLGAMYVYLAEKTEAEFNGLVSEREERAHPGPPRRPGARGARGAFAWGGASPTVASGRVRERPDR